MTACVECGADDLVGFSARAGGAVCRAHAAGSFALSPRGSPGSSSCSRLRSRMRPPPGSATGPAARRSRSSRPPTRSTEVSGCERSPHEARPRRRLRARRRPGTDRRRGGSPLHLGGVLLGARTGVRASGAPRPRRDPRGRALPRRASGRVLPGGRRPSASRTCTSRTSTSSPSTAAAASGSSLSRRWSSAARMPIEPGSSTPATRTSCTGSSVSGSPARS